MRKRIDQNLTDRFEPVKAIGKLLFFDYNKNKFGFISEVKGGNIVQVNKVHLSEKGLSTNKRLHDGELVALTLNKDQKGFYATGVKSFDEITIKEVSDIIELLEINEIAKVVSFTLGNNHNKLDNDDKILIGNLLLKNNDVDSWKLLVKIEDDELIETYIKTQIVKLNQEEKIIFLQKSFNSKLFFSIISEWSKSEKALVLKLIEIIQNKEISIDQIPKTFLNILINLEWTFEEIWKIYSVLNLTEIANLVLNLYSFSAHDCNIKLNKLFTSNLSSEEVKNKLISKLHSEKDKISLNKLIEILTDFKDDSIVETENQLFEFLTEIANLALSLFSFTAHDSKENLIKIFTSNLISEEVRRKLITKLHSERGDISASKLVEIFTDLKVYKIIENENQLLELLSDTVFKDSEFKDLISILTEECEISSFRKIVVNNIKDISSWRVIELIESCGQKHELTKIFIDEFYLHYGNYSNPEYGRLIDFLKKKNNAGLNNYFIDKFYTDLAIKYPIEILDLAIKSNHINAQKLAYQNLKFYSEDGILSFIKSSESIIITDEVKKSNEPLSGFIAFIKSTSDFELTDQCKRFLQINQGIVQCLSVKFLIYQLHKQLVTKTKITDILNSFHWTEISALLVKAFIEESNYTEKILLDKLNGIFKTHFEILSNQNFERKSFLDNFTIRNILNTCNGRKFYNADLWQGKRWYVKGRVTTRIKETMDCYCEGRPWKKEPLWNSHTNTPSTELYEFYWCKTSYCAERNDTVDFNRPFNNWTLSEIASTLNIQIEKIALATLAGWANRMNQIVSHLFCRKCNEVLRPLPFRPSILGYYAVPLFHCINENCTEKQIIRFTHCLNGKCVSHITSDPLDSRDCKSCNPNDPNHTGLECNYCGSSCPACSGHHKKIIAQEVW